MSMLLALMLVAGAEPAPQLDASRVTPSAPTQIVELDTGKLKGELACLAWSPDGQQLYVQTVEQDRASVKARHFLLTLDGQAPRGVDREPPWASAYWFWKSAQAAPGVPTFKIEVEQQRKRITATATPMAGDMARGVPTGGTGTGGGQGVSVEEAAGAAYQSQMADTFTLKLKGEIVGEFVNRPAAPGLTFGWGPAGTGLIAFANREGHVVIMDDQGRKQEVPASKAALLPAWTDDGTRLAYLEKTGRKKFVLKVVEVKRPTS